MKRDALLIGLGLVAAAAAVALGKSRSGTCGPDGGEINGIRYLEKVRGTDDPEQPMPMVVVFHSRGARPEGAASFPGLDGPVRIIRPQGFNPTPAGKFTWFSKSSHNTETALGMVPEMRQRAAELVSFLNALRACRPTIGRPIVTGSSEGGHVAYLLASEAPGAVTGAVALLGYIPEPLWSSSMAPTVGLHTTGDQQVTYSRTAAFWDAVKQAGAPLTTQTFSGGHSVVSPMGSAWRDAVTYFVSQASS